MQQLFHFSFSSSHRLSSQFHKLFDRISSQVVSRTPPGDAIARCRDAVDAIQSATSHKYSRDKAELVHLLGSPHIQVSDDIWDLSTRFVRSFVSNITQKAEALFAVGCDKLTGEWREMWNCGEPNY